jgi:GNAT superfamily N-acetyltransferase
VQRFLDLKTGTDVFNTRYAVSRGSVRLNKPVPVLLAVSPTRQRRGIAAKLIAKVEQKLVELGCPKLELMVRKSNPEVIAFYDSVGFKPDPVIVMSKRLIKDDEHDYG